MCQVCPTHLYAETQHKILYCQRGFMDRSTPSPVLTPLKDPSDSALLRVPHHYRWFTEASCGPCYCSEMSIPRTHLCLQKVECDGERSQKRGPEPSTCSAVLPELAQCQHECQLELKKKVMLAGVGGGGPEAQTPEETPPHLLLPSISVLSLLKGVMTRRPSRSLLPLTSLGGGTHQGALCGLTHRTILTPVWGLLSSLLVVLPGRGRWDEARRRLQDPVFSSQPCIPGLGSIFPPDSFAGGALIHNI